MMNVFLSERFQKNFISKEDCTINFDGYFGNEEDEDNLFENGAQKLHR
jgi:hypothetical protein